MVLQLDAAKVNPILLPNRMNRIMVFLKKRTEFNTELTSDTKKKAFPTESHLNSVFVLFQCYRFINRYFFKKCFYQ